MTTDYQARISNCLDRRGKRQHRPKRKQATFTDKSGWVQPELDLAGEVEERGQPEIKHALSRLFLAEQRRFNH